jgi:hypothetical protein
MTYARDTHSIDTEAMPRMPAWVGAARAEVLEDVSFFSGAALSHLHLVMARREVPPALLRDRLALRAAEACAGFSGRRETVAEMRDALHVLRPGDLPGPAGEICLQWRRAAERGLSVKALQRALPGFEAAQIAGWLDAGQGGPLGRAALVLEAVLVAKPQAESAALILADAALALALGWDHLLPLLACGVKRSDLRKRGADLRLACHRALTASAIEAARMAVELARRAAHLRAVAPKLRAKGAEAAVQIFLTRDAVAPSALPLPDRAARRLCDRLVELGAVRELTGRDSFRLYGV